jgi:hypothetical protein
MVYGRGLLLGSGVRAMSRELEDKIKKGIINSAPDKEGADWVKSAIDSGRIIIMS